MAYTLLLADDSVTIQRVIELTFAEEDITVVTFSDGGHAIASLRHTRPDIVLADVGMPGQNGYEVARYIKSQPSLATIPVLLLTGAFEPVDPVRAAEVRCDGVLTKPFEPRRVVERVKQLLAQSARPAAVEPAPAPVESAAALKESAAVAEPSAVPAESGPPPVEPRPAAVAALDDYFAQLDQAIAARAVEPPPPGLGFGILPTTSEPPSVPMHRPSTGAPPASAPPVRVPLTAAPLASAFSALLAAEGTGEDPFPTDDWAPEAAGDLGAAVTAPPIVLSEDVIDLVVRRVLERLSGQVQDTVRDLASSTAERLVREEIERIKSHIK